MNIVDLLIKFDKFAKMADFDYAKLVKDRAKKILTKVPDERHEAETAILTFQEESLIGDDDMVFVEVLRKAIAASTGVCKFFMPGRGMASGFLVGRQFGRGYVMTNNHVLPTKDSAKTAYVQFDYEKDLEENAPNRKKQISPCLPDQFYWTDSALDVAVVAIDLNNMPDIAPLKLSYNDPIRGEKAIIIHHPGGKYKSVSFVDCKILYVGTRCFYYELDTLGGSSGSIVYTLLDNEVSGLHRGAGPQYDTDTGKYRNLNEAVRMSLILQSLSKSTFPMEMISQ